LRGVLFISHFSLKKWAETKIIITAKTDPAIPERNQGVKITSIIGNGLIPFFTNNQSKTKCVVTPIRKPKKAKETNNFVLPKDTSQSRSIKLWGVVSSFQVRGCLTSD